MRVLRQFLEAYESSSVPDEVVGRKKRGQMSVVSGCIASGGKNPVANQKRWKILPPPRESRGLRERADSNIYIGFLDEGIQLLLLMYTVGGPQ